MKVGCATERRGREILATQLGLEEGVKNRVAKRNRLVIP